MIDLVVISDEEKIFDGKVSKIDIKTENGPVSILPKHEPYLSKIEELISYTKENNAAETHKIARGFLYTNGDSCFAIVDI